MANPFPILRQRSMVASTNEHLARLHRNYTPAVKGQITKALKQHKENRPNLHKALMAVFLKLMPKEQAKHQAKKHIRLAYPVM